jgi:hypothetical protein
MEKKMQLKVSSLFQITLISLFLQGLAFSSNAQAYDKIGRLGLGLSNQLKNDFPSLSFKMQKNRSTAIGGNFGLSSDPTSGGYGAGIKIYRNLFDEPQLNFYVAGLLGLLNNKVSSTSYSGFQFDLSLGSEFHLTGLNSIGFSFEFGVSAYKKKEFTFQTLGNSFIVSGVHFYL